MPCHPLLRRFSSHTTLAPKPAIREIVVFSFAIAFAIRVFWAVHVQHPSDAVYSDMAGYVLRAKMLLAGQVGGEPRMLALWPWGTHTIVAGEIYAFGEKSIVGVGLCQGLVGALAAPCAALLTLRFVPGRLPALIAGLTVATWEPHIAYSGFFSSEVWFSSAMMLGTLFAVRYSERRRLLDALLCGVLLGLTFVTRPQILLTVLLVLGFIVLARLQSRTLFPANRRRAGGALLALAAFFVPLLVMMGASSLRFYRLMGRPGLIAAYEPIQRVFAETDVVKIESGWTTASGERWTFWFKSAAKDVYKPITPGTTEVFEGFIADPEILGEIKRRRLANVPTSARIGRMLNNVSLLIAKNRPWPESDTQVKYRRVLMIGYSNAIWVVLGLAMVGVFALKRSRAAEMLVRAQLLTIFLVGAIYIGEARYRVPYDPLLIVVATVGLFAIARQVVDRWGTPRVRDVYFYWQRRLS